MNKEHKCKINFELWCGNACCKYCLGIDECDWACHGNPESCGLTKDTDSKLIVISNGNNEYYGYYVKE